MKPYFKVEIWGRFGEVPLTYMIVQADDYDHAVEEVLTQQDIPWNPRLIVSKITAAEMH